MERTDPLDVANSINLILWVLGMAVGAVFTTVRYVRYLIKGQRPPELLTRDMLARLAIALPFGGVLLVRVLDIPDASAQPWYPWWVIGSGVVAVLGAWYYVWYEAFRIER